ncbi:hypothetical protein [Pseudomonas sp. EMN2]|uniref:hypothetical protein n=1 Tax=Pseudomonas sp. EMN2 TaxID=2615212 RepID=UPI00129B1259|nr:hypothetical protein [Pseudomonas sp. EMN2]
MSKQQKMRTNSIYAPLRYAATRPFAQRLGTEFIEQVRLGKAERHKFISEKLMFSIQSSIAQLGRPAGPGPAQAEITNVQTFGSFMGGGALIFDLSDHVPTLLSTDVSTVPLWALPAIADSFYLHFGRNDKLEQDDVSIEGVFVTWFKPKDEPSRLILDFVTKTQFNRTDFWLVEAGEPFFGCSVEISNPDLSVRDALERSVHQIVENNKAVEAQIEELIKRMEALHGKAVVSVPTQVHDLTTKLPVLRRGLALVANSLLYLGATRAGDTHQPSSQPGASSSSGFSASVIVC